MSSVSFIVPVYNKSRFLKNVVESLKNQKGSFVEINKNLKINWIH